MKDYSLNERERKSFITDVYHKEDDTYMIVFADGRVFDNIEVCDENFNKIVEIQEEQARRGIENMHLFQKRVSKTGFITALVGTALISTGIIGYFETPIMQTQDPILVTTSYGLIAIMGIVPCLAKLKKDGDKITELKKLLYRNVHKRELDQYRDYPNALSGIDRQKRKNMENFEDPFNILNMDSFTEEDLRMIVSNIHREKGYQFVYKQ